jgi:NAD(P)-dependent dehydrogenase (short-subunit alcohol dehydrogenase family)
MNNTPESLNTRTPPANLLQDRIILITGAARGIGQAVAKAMAAHGATTILLDRDVPGLEQTYDAIVAAGHPEPALYPMDLQGAEPDDYSRLATTLADEFGHLDGLIHNAAQLGALVPFANYDNELWFQNLQANLNAPYLLTMACLGLLNSSEDASIVFTSDAVGRKGKAYWGAYGVSKAGMEIFMQTLAEELESNTSIRVNSIDPGAVNTALRRIAYPAEDSSLLRSPEEVTRAFLYLAGPESRGITGKQFTLDAML